MNEQEFDQILSEMRQETCDPAAEAAARERVRSNLAAGPACLQFRSEFEEYGAGKLGEAQALLLEDHLTRCAGCRRSFNSAPVVAMPVAAPSRRFAIPRWAIAAGIAVTALYLGRNALDRAMAPSGPRATVEAASGVVYALNAATLANGAGIADGEVLRTAAGTRAQLRLADGSLVEVNERTELFVNAAWSGSTIHLQRGDIIVRAAKQRRGYLKVVTRDSEAAVKGTIFTVSTGTAGSLVGVVEGSVAVTQPGTEAVLKPGEQATTSAALKKVSVREAVSWSAEKDKHFALLSELAAIEKQLTISTARTSAKLISLLPPDVVVYGAIPNLGPTMDQAMNLIEQRSRDNAVLQEWWTSKSAAEMRGMIDRVRVLAPMLGEELVFVLVKPNMPLVMAEVKKGQEAALDTELKKLLPGGAAYRVANGTLLITRSAAVLEALSPRLGQGTGTPFAQEISKRYARGVAWILGADVEGIGMKRAPELLGANQVKYAFVEQRTVQGVEENEATVTFTGPRTGVASWLAEPGSAGSTEYASADAVAVFSAATRNPRQIVEELTGLVPGIADSLREMETKTGVNIANDLAAALGTDFTLSLETAAVPIPGWFAAIEVYQPATLNAAIARLVDAYNREASAERKVVLKQEVADGRQWYSVTLSGFGLHWTFDRGYWLVSMDRAVTLRAIATRAGGFPLIRSEQFRAQMPTLAGLHPSGFAWFNLGSAASVISSFVSSPQLQKFLAVREPSLITFNGETERIQVASRTRFTSLMMDTMLQAHMGGKKKVMKNELRGY
ncbi:MAG: FecR domain-containing protein [Acidobacteria bacterium]|nr:FecR domain-containing protein [Acidobacteriota bacterium]